MFKYLILLLFLGCSIKTNMQERVFTGAEVLISDSLHLIKNKKVGLVSNHTGLLNSGEHIAEVLFQISDVQLAALFGPEHGFSGNTPDGEKIHNTTSNFNNIPVYSLYGENFKPTPEMFKNIDIVLFDIQDIGSRFYTYISTMFYVMEACAEQNIPIIILDRPNPINGIYIEGPILDVELKSFVGIAPLPIAHGMTIAELALFFVGEKLIHNSDNLNITYIPMKNWKRKMFYDETGLNWIKPSPNMTTLETAILYPGLCLLEGTNFSEGRGTKSPFLIIGAPFVKNKIAEKLNSINIPGVGFKDTSFTPIPIKDMSENPKHVNQLCNGVSIELTNRNKFNSVEAGLTILSFLFFEFEENFKLRETGINRLFGKNWIYEEFPIGVKAEELINRWKPELEKFKQLRKKYLLYD